MTIQVCLFCNAPAVSQWTIAPNDPLNHLAFAIQVMHATNKGTITDNPTAVYGVCEECQSYGPQFVAKMAEHAIIQIADARMNRQ